MFGKKKTPEPDLRPAVPLNVMSFEELLGLKMKIESMIAARVPEELTATKVKLQSLAASAGITISQLFGAAEKTETKNKKKKSAPAPKLYRNPETGETYSKGPFPEWLKAALDAGASKEQFLVHINGA